MTVPTAPVPPTTPIRVACAIARRVALRRRASPVSPQLRSRGGRERAAERDLVGVLEIAADGQAAREARHPHLLAQAVGEVGGGRLAGHRRVRREDDLADAVRVDAADQLVDPQVGRVDAVDRAERAAEHVVEAVVGVRALERDDVDGLLDDADRRVVAAAVEADRAGLLLGQVAALAAEANALLHLGERRGESERLLGRPLQDVEGKPLRGPLPDSGQARQLRDEVLDRGAEHGAIVPAAAGQTSPAGRRGSSGGRLPRPHAADGPRGRGAGGGCRLRGRRAAAARGT